MKVLFALSMSMTRVMRDMLRMVPSEEAQGVKEW